MTLYSDPPSLRPFKYDKPTLLVCWWATSFCTVMIFLRVAGRFIRTERLFREDKIAALALVPLLLRMACVHVILLNGTNNSDFTGTTLTDDEIHYKSVASGLVLVSRILYAATLWTLKGAILEFLRRLTDLTWEKAHQTTLVAIRWILVSTFIAVIISDLVECHTFHHYWQVLPDPGPQCRQGYAQLITMAVCNVFTDILLVVFPIPIILKSRMTLTRKVQLVLLFSLSLAVVVVTLYRVPHIIENQGRQQYRSLLASVELLFATAAANALVLGSFVRDRGVKKQKFKRSSAADSFDRGASNTRRPTLHQHWGSDEDLVRDVGLMVEPELRKKTSDDSPGNYYPAPIFKQTVDEDGVWNAPKQPPGSSQTNDDSIGPFDSLSKIESNSAQRKLSFFDVGGLLDDPVGTSSASYRRGSVTSSTLDPNSTNSSPPAAIRAASNGLRRGSAALLQDIGGLLGPRTSRSKTKPETELQELSKTK